MQSKFIKHTFIFAVATFISRIFGFVRDATIAFVFGANSLTDAFFVAWRLPNTLRQLLAEGGFNAVFIPFYNEVKKSSLDEAKVYISSMFSYYVLVLSVITVLAVLFSKFIVLLIAPGFAKNEHILNVASNIVKIVFPYLILVGIVSFFMALLNTKGRFFIPAVSPALLNLSFILFSLLFSNYLGIYALAFGALFGGFLQVALTFYQFKKEGFSLKPTLRLHPKVKQTFKGLLPSFITFGVDQISFIINTIIASLISAGAISYLYYANRVFQLPIGIIGNGLGNSLIASLSQHFANGNIKEFLNDLENGIKLAVIFAVPASFGMVVLGREIVDVLFLRGAFDNLDASNTYLALVGYAVGLSFALAGKPLRSAYFSMKDFKTPVFATVFGVFVGFLVAVVCVFWLGLGVFGISFASSVGALVYVVYMVLFFPYEINFKDVLKTFLKATFASVLFSVVLLLMKPFFKSEVLTLFTGIIISLFVYFAVMYISGDSLTKKALASMLKKFKR